MTTEPPDPPLPSLEACASLLGAAPALGAFRRAIFRSAPAEARGWVGALGVVARSPDGIRSSDVADLLHVDLSVASRHLTELEQLGLVERGVDASDRRARLIRITGKGEAWVSGFKDEFAGQLRERLEGWSDADIATLTKLLARFGASLEDAT